MILVDLLLYEIIDLQSYGYNYQPRSGYHRHVLSVRNKKYSF